MANWIFFRAAIGLSLLASSAGPAWSQSLKGALGPQSRASIRIEVSVMPTFKASGLSATEGFSSNAPTLRYSLVKDPQALEVAAAKAERSVAKRQGPPVVMLVVPD